VVATARTAEQPPGQSVSRWYNECSKSLPGAAITGGFWRRRSRGLRGRRTLDAELDIFLVRKLGADVTDETVCARTPEPFRAVGLWYRDFSETTDDEVRSLLRQHAERLRAGGR
jgi:hypothetical protein